MLLHKLGFHLPTDAAKLFVRIPEFWTASILYNVAAKLGPIDKSNLKFDFNQFNLKDETEFNSALEGITANTNDYFQVSRPKQINSLIR